MKRFPCPKCGRMLSPDGQVRMGDLTAPVYVCGECIRVVDFLGATRELPMLFVVGVDGRAFDPADPEADLSR